MASLPGITLLLGSLSLSVFADDLDMTPGFARGELASALNSDDECCGVGETTCALGLAQLRAAERRSEASPAKVDSSKHSKHAKHLKHAGKHQSEDAAKHEADASSGEKHKDSKGKAGKDEHPNYEHPEWIKSCSKIFLDLGSHIGVNIRKFYEPKRYPGAKLTHFFDESIGSSAWRRVAGNKTGVCALGFEPNPRESPRLKRLEEAYQKQGWHVHFYPLAAWSSEGYMALKDAESKKPGVVKEKDTKAKETVRTADLAKFIQTLPPNSVKLMVMDIDGAEYETLARLIQQSVLCNNTIGKALVGAHDYGDVKHWGNERSFVQGTDPRSFAAINERVEQLQGVKWCADDSVTQVQEFDDDTYTDDVDDAFGKSPAELKKLALKDGKPNVAFMSQEAPDEISREVVISVIEDVDDAVDTSPAELKKLALKDGKPPLAFMSQEAPRQMVIQVGGPSDLVGEPN